MKKFLGIITLSLMVVSLAAYLPSNFPNGIGVSEIISPDTAGGSGKLQINVSTVNIAEALIVNPAFVPTASSSNGQPGQISWDDGYFYWYRNVTPNSWYRVSGNLF